MTPSPLTAETQLVIPEELRPADGRFGCGPSKVRPEALARLASAGGAVMGTSHRQKPVKALVGEIRAGLCRAVRGARGLRGGARQRRRDRLLGRRRVWAGGSRRRCIWSMASSPRSSRRSPRRRRSSRIRASSQPTPAMPPMSMASASLATEEHVDVIAWAHNETSTGVMVPVRRPAGADALVLIDATSGAGGLPVEVAQADAYYFAPQKGFAGDGGLWVALLSPAAQERIAELHASERWIPAFLSLHTALENSLKDQTYNTPAVATLFLLAEPDSLDARRRRPRLVCRAHDGLLRAPVRLGRADRVHGAVRARPREALARRGDDRLRPRRWTRPRLPPRCARTGSSTSSPTASWGATSCGSGCSRRSTPPMCRRSPRVSIGSWRGRQHEHRHGGHCA